MGLFLDRRNRSKNVYTPGAPVVIDLDMGGKVLDGSIILHGQVVISGGTTNGGTIGEGGPINLIKRIKLTCNAASGSKYPSGKYIDVTPRSLLRYAITQHNGGRFIGEIAGSTLGNGATGTYNIYLEIPIFFADFNGRVPMQTALNLDPGVYSDAQLQIDLATDLSACFSGSDRSVSFAGLFVDWKDSRLNLQGDTVPLIQEDHIMQIDSTFDRKVDKSMPNDGNFLQWLILAEQSTNQTLANTLLNKLTVNGVNGVVEEYAQDIQTRMLSDGWWGVPEPVTGCYFIDWVNGNNANSNPAVGLSTQWDVNLVSAANQDQFRIYTRRWLPLAQ